MAPRHLQQQGRGGEGSRDTRGEPAARWGASMQRLPPHSPAPAPTRTPTSDPRACANAVSTVCTTLEEVQVMVGTVWCASALVFRLVLMYTT